MDNDNADSVRDVLIDADRPRLDKALATALPDLSRTRIKSLIKEGRVAAADGPLLTDPSAAVKCGQALNVTIPAAIPAVPEAQDIPLSIVFEDDDLIVLDKPAGLVVHPAAGNPDKTLVNALLAHCGDSLSGIGGVRRPGIVHRLDKDTSGLMVVAKNDAAHHHLSSQFADRSLSRTYYALVWGLPSPRRGTIEGNIGRSPKNRKKMAVVGTGGKTAVTHYKVIRAVGTRAALVACKLETGRTHQIRVHLAHIGHSIVGDSVYGRAPGKHLRGIDSELRAEISAFNHQALHAYFIRFIHPMTGECKSFSSKLSKKINELINRIELIKK